MRPLVWWVQDHLGLTAVGLLGIAAVVVAIVIATSGGSSETPPSASKVAANGSAETAPSAAGEQATPAQTSSHYRAHAAAAHDRNKARRQAAEPTPTAKPSTQRKSHAADSTPPRQPQTQQTKSQQPNEAAHHSLGQATAEKVAAAHPGTSCPKSYSRKQCEEAVQAAADPAPSIPVTQPSDCTKAMSEAQCEELFAAEAAARAAGTGAVSIQECMEHPEQEKCVAVVEQMKAQYEAAHPGG